MVERRSASVDASAKYKSQRSKGERSNWECKRKVRGSEATENANAKHKAWGSEATSRRAGMSAANVGDNLYYV